MCCRERFATWRSWLQSWATTRALPVRPCWRVKRPAKLFPGAWCELYDGESSHARGFLALSLGRSIRERDEFHLAANWFFTLGRLHPLISSVRVQLPGFRIV